MWKFFFHFFSLLFSVFLVSLQNDTSSTLSPSPSPSPSPSSLSPHPAPAPAAAAISAQSLPFCMDFQSFHFDIYQILNATTTGAPASAPGSSYMPIQWFVQSIVDRSNCTAQHDDCQMCSYRLIENLADSSNQSDTFHRATVRLLIAAVAPKMACEERQQPSRRTAEQALNGTAIAAGTGNETLTLVETTLAGDDLAMARLMVGPISDQSIDRFFTRYAYLFRSPGSDGRKDDRCFDTSRTMSALRKSSGDDQYVQLAQMTTGFIYLNYSYPCRTPSKDIFLRQLFASYGSGEHLTRSNFSRMINDLKLFSPSSDRRRERAAPAALKPACFSLDIILETFDVHATSAPMSWSQFAALSPALLHQKLQCAKSAVPRSEEKGDLNVLQKWGFGVASVAVMSAASIVGVFVFPLVKGAAYDATLHFFIALAVASLTGDALLHLIPFFVGMHDHSHSDDGEEGVHVAPYFYKLLAANMAIFGFYLFELLLRALMPSARSMTEKSHELGDLEGTINRAYAEDGVVVVDDRTHDHHHHDHREHSLPGDRQKQPMCCGMTAVSAMITLGDGLHNFADGMAIAAAFSSSSSLGLSTSVAILCHEIPHELGDMAVYLSTGMSMLKAVGLNLLSSLACFVGLFVGYGIASQSSVAQEWILAVTSGFFLYIALTDLLPELSGPAQRNPKLILCHLFGFIIGALIIVVIALFEEKIRL